MNEIYGIIYLFLRRGLKMKISQIISLLDSMPITMATNEDYEITHAFGADLMSDVLCYSPTDCLMITGLSNIHALRTAEMTGMQTILFVRGKIPTEEMIDEAKNTGTSLLFTSKTMFEVCGILYINGVKPKPREK